MKIMRAASILSTLEPVVTVALAFVAFGSALGPAQLAGGALVLAAALTVQADAAVRRLTMSSPPPVRL